MRLKQQNTAFSALIMKLYTRCMEIGKDCFQNRERKSASRKKVPKPRTREGNKRSVDVELDPDFHLLPIPQLPFS